MDHFDQKNNWRKYYPQKKGGEIQFSQKEKKRREKFKITRKSAILVPLKMPSTFGMDYVVPQTIRGDTPLLAMFGRFNFWKNKKNHKQNKPKSH
ncbi:hypothetical protein M0813_23278 [Anaeramoeba flamelloides]|uniref:Uncharacterized protein n=1 Tax=Anaeramoeba flamelloides TaxID=1746091 RepID=A0ABQ8Y9J7_9EUKA|nr:hypothetical protein M0813_23278 [Anaeramoeba flamelloides]